ncbi:MAG: protein kinase domain-containing protein [Planctomycetota bacterium]
MPRLLVENGADRGKSYIVRGDGPFFAGRDTAAQVPIPDEMASRRHFQIETRAGSFYIRDLSSSNGTYLNGSLLTKPESLAPNDRIQVGNTLITFQDDKPHPLIGQEIAGYRILDRIGRGGMGTVYRALQTSLDRIVALKVLAPHLVKNTSFVNLFIREARSAGALSHPNIVQVYDVGVQGDIYYFSMEYIPDGSVEDLLNRHSAIPLPRALQVVRDAARGLQYAEQLGIIHRDIKPGNLMVGSGTVVKIGDLGISRSTEGEGQASQKDGVSGSPHYIAPEQARGQDIDSRVDIYSLGVSLYQILCGATPFRGATPREVILKHLKEEPQPLTERVPGLPPAVARLVERMMAKDREQRIASATLLLEELEPLIKQYGQGSAEKADRRVRPARLVFGVLALCVLAGLGGGAVYFHRLFEEQRLKELQVRATSDQALDAIERELAAGGLEAAQAKLLDAAKLVFDEPQQARYQQLVDATTALKEQRAADEREREAARILSELEVELETLKGASSEAAPWQERRALWLALASRFEELAAAHPANASAPQARERATDLRSSVAARNKREDDARKSLDSVAGPADAWQSRGLYKSAREVLKKFDANAFQDTAAHVEYTEIIRQLERRETDDWESVKLNIDEDIKNRRFPAAEQKRVAFRERAAFAATVDQVDEYARVIAEGQRTVTNSVDPTLEAELGTVYAAVDAATEVWVQTLSHALALQELRRPELLGLGKDARELLSRYEVFFASWEAQFRRLCERDVATRQVVLKREEGGAKTERVKLKDFSVDRVNLIEPATYVKWREISALSKFELLSLVVASPSDFVSLGLLAHCAGNPEERDRVWRDAEGSDSASAVAIRDWREWIERAKKD